MSQAPAVGVPVYTADGDKLGKVKDVADEFFKIRVPLRRDCWLATNWIRDDESENQVVLDFEKERLNDFKLPAPGA